jgi:hypothetical protein
VFRQSRWRITAPKVAEVAEPPPPPVYLAEVSEEEFEELKMLVMEQRAYIEELQSRPEPEVIYETVTAEPVIIVEEDKIAQERADRIYQRLLTVPRVTKAEPEK